MDWTQALASALGLGFLAGIRLYGTVLAVGLAVRFGLIQLPAQLSQLHILADNRVLAVAGVAFLAEFFADKVPWVDSTWDAIHTFIRPIGAAVLGATAVWHADPATQMAVALLSGGVALAGHSAKAATRYAVNHSPEPFSNIALSLAGDLALPFGVWLWAVHPYVMLACVIAYALRFDSRASPSNSSWLTRHRRAPLQSAIMISETQTSKPNETNCNTRLLASTA